MPVPYPPARTGLAALSAMLLYWRGLRLEDIHAAFAWAFAEAAQKLASERKAGAGVAVMAKPSRVICSPGRYLARPDAHRG